MQLKKVAVKNFRLLHDIEVLLEKKTTVIVGRNNSGKTSLTEVMTRLLGSKHSTFRFEDFSFCAHKQFWDALAAFAAKKSEEDVRNLLPAIEIKLTFSYDVDEPLGLMSDFIVDLTPECTEALVIIRYALMDGKLADLFADIPSPDEKIRAEYFVAMRDRTVEYFGTSLFAADPNDETNRKAIDASALRALCASGFISAQRGLDDASQKDRVVIGKVLENLFSTAQANPDDADSHKTAKDLEEAVKDVQEKISGDFNQKLDALLPALSIFGYPGLTDPKLLTETTLDVSQLLTGHTKVFYTGSNGIHLPEAYNGLGMRNIILILLQLREFFKLYSAMTPKPAVQVVFVEEPEVHLHPQMQEVFIRKLGEIAEVFSKEAGTLWPVQFVVSTHSSHVANETHFETIRYFHCVTDPESGTPKASVKDLRKGLTGKAEPDRSFLHQYMTLTRCDLFFADKAVLIEGTTERLLLPKIIGVIDSGQLEGKKLGSQYLSVIEIGGAYAHIFFDLLEFLEIRALVITDIDTVKANENKSLVACPVSDGAKTSNACIKSWFDKPDIAPATLMTIDAASKIVGKRRIAFQLPETDGGPCGRSFEDAFMLANPQIFGFAGPTEKDREIQAWEEAKGVKKSEFALKYALTVDQWNVPRYIREGLVWLADSGVSTPPAIAPDKVQV
jgi:putative ATP-dependent endonuclease of OLD family